MTELERAVVYERLSDIEYEESRSEIDDLLDRL